MGRRTIRTLQWIVVTVSLSYAAAAGAAVALGASFGYTHFSYPSIDYINLKNDVVGIPSDVAWGQPGIRAGYLSRAGRWDLNVDMGLEHASGTIGEGGTMLELLPQLQLSGVPRGRSKLSPFVNGGLGIRHEEAEEVVVTRPMFGAGLGIRRFVSDRHGLIRLELRYDHVPEKSKDGPFEVVSFASMDMFSVKLGFDLMLSSEVTQDKNR